MKRSSLLRSGVLLLVVMGLIAACGSGNNKKKVPGVPNGDGGEAGQGDAPNAGSAGKGGAGKGGASANGGNAGDLGGAADEAGSGGESGAVGGEGGAGGAGPVFHGLYVGIDGLDTNGGSHDEPFLTLAHAISVAQAGDTIVFLDGTFAAAPVATVPDGVDVMAEHSGAAKLTCSANLFTFAGSSRVEGLEFDACPQPIVAISAGQLTMVDLFFVSGGTETGAVHLGGTVKATLTGASDHVYSQGGANLFFLSETASLSVTGGTFKAGNNGGFSGNGLFRTANSAKLSLKDVVVVDVKQAAVSAGDTSTVTLDHAAMDLVGDFVVLLRNNPTFITKNGTRLALKPTADPGYECLRFELSGGSVNIDDTEITGCNAAINSVLPTTLTISNSTLHHNDGLAMDLGSYQSSAPISTVTISNTEISDNGTAITQIHGGIRLGAAILNLKLRGVTFKDIGGSATDATDMYLTASNGSNFDFGTLADPGLNTFQTNGLGSGLRFQSANFSGLTVQAVGNTWTPNVQGADPQGKYAVPVGGPKTFDAVGPISVNSGAANYQLSTTTTLRLAEKP